MPIRSVGEIAADLQGANEVLVECEKAESIARSKATGQRNRVNELQKEMDAAIVAMRNAAGNDTDWGSRRRSGKHLAAE